MSTLSSQSASALRASEVRVPADKSITHRALLLSAIAQGRSIVRNRLESADCEATLAALRQCGVSCQTEGDALFIDGVGLSGLRAPVGELDFGNSGTGMRLMSGILSAQSFETVLSGDASLSRRPMQRIIEPLTLMGANIESLAGRGLPPLKVRPSDALHGIDYALPVDSAQVQSCVLLAGLRASGETCVRSRAPVRDHTVRMLRSFGARIEASPQSARLRGGELTATEVRVPGDFSSAIFFIVAATIVPQSDLTLIGVGINPTRTAALDILTSMGANIEVLNRRSYGLEPVADIRVRAARLSGVDIPVESVTSAVDDFPVLFIAAAVARGTTRLRGASELRVKESDRIATMAAGLKACGIKVTEVSDGLDIVGGGGGAAIRGARIDSADDHRISMAFLIAGAVCDDGLIVERCDNIATSFPNFVDLANNIQLRIAPA